MRRSQKKKLSEKEVQFQKNTEESEPVCKIFSGELEIIQRNNLKEQATSSLHHERDWEKEAEEQGVSLKTVQEEGLSPGQGVQTNQKLH